MASPAEDLAPERYLPHLRTSRIGRIYQPLLACESTNDLAARRGQEGAAEGLLVVADRQTAGRGRLGRSWHSSPGDNLTFSLLLRPSCLVPALPPLTLLTGVVLARVLATLGLRPRLKWPNDVVIEEKGVSRKLVGILTEMASERDRIKHLVIGVGVNVNTTDFPPELSSRATSLRMATGRPHDRGALLAEIASAFEPAYDEALALGADSFLPSWRQFAALPRLCRLERPTGPLEGMAVDVDQAGALLVRDAAGRSHRVFSGEMVSD
jgi:BirA family biotin operon repressor/biotin-[acetyl-CoA-carboxylase] ligase